MGETYNDKSLNQIKNDVRTEFNDTKNFRIRDDQEIYASGLNVIKKYKDEVLKSNRLTKKERYIVGKDGKPVIFKSGNEYRKYAKRFFTEAYNKIVDLHNNVKGLIKFTSDAENEKIITDVAKKIDQAENDALKKIADYCNPMQEGNNASYHSSVVKDEHGRPKVNNGRIETQKPLFTQSRDGTLTFTDRTNPLKIHQALGNLFKDKSKVYKIDYSKCKNPNIKAKMQNAIGGLSCWIKYDKNSQTYVLTDKTGKILSNRALVWEGVTLKQDTIIESQARDNEGPGMTDEERNSLENLRSTSEPFAFDVNNYRYYEQLRATLGKQNNICATYAYGVVSDILAKKGCYFAAPEVSAWEISSSKRLEGKFTFNTIDKNNPQQQIINAPAGTFFTVKFDRTSHQDRGVSHVMVSLGNGVYTDLFGYNIRQIDFKSEANFSGNKFTCKGGSYTITENSRLISPIIGSFNEGAEQTLNGENITPNEFAEKIYQSTGVNIHYIKSLISRQNNIPYGKFGEKVSNISVKFISKQITDLELENNEGSNDVANDFLDSLKHYKREIMDHYPNLTNHEYDEIAKRAMGILYQESNSGDSIKYHTKENEIVGTLIAFRKLVNGDERSRGYTQIKFNQIFSDSDKKFLNSYGINDGSDLTNAKKCGIATMVGLIRKYYDYIVPMRSNPFRKNSATITRVTYKDNHIEEFARGKAVPIRGEKNYRVRTDEEFEAAKNALCDKHGPIQEVGEVHRPGITNPDDFFDFIYYAWNQPSQIVYGTATPHTNQYITQSNGYINQNTNNGTIVA